MFFKEIRERSPSPAASPSTPPLDLTTLHEQVDSSEPLTSQASWSHSRGVEQEQVERVKNSQMKTDNFSLVYKYLFFIYLWNRMNQFQAIKHFFRLEIP